MELNMFKTNGGVASGESLTMDMQFFQVATMVALQEGNVNTETPTAKDNFERLVQFLSQWGQPVIRSLTAVANVARPDQTYGMGTNYNRAATVYVYQFAVEHATVATVTAMATALEGLKAAHGGVDFLTAGADVKNTVITKREVL